MRDLFGDACRNAFILPRESPHTLRRLQRCACSFHPIIPDWATAMEAHSFRSNHDAHVPWAYVTLLRSIKELGNHAMDICYDPYIRDHEALEEPKQIKQPQDSPDYYPAFPSGIYHCTDVAHVDAGFMIASSDDGRNHIKCIFMDGITLTPEEWGQL